MILIEVKVKTRRSSETEGAKLARATATRTRLPDPISPVRDPSFSLCISEFQHLVIVSLFSILCSLLSF